MNIKKVLSSILAVIGLSTGCTAQKMVTTLPPAEFADAIKSNISAVVLDVRTQEEYEAGHLEDALLLDYLQEETFNQAITNLDANKTYYVYCRSGRRSHEAAVKMQDRGLNVVDMKGGYLAWTAKGMPTTTTTNTIK